MSRTYVGNTVREQRLDQIAQRVTKEHGHVTRTVIMEREGYNVVSTVSTVSHAKNLRDLRDLRDRAALARLDTCI
jgi:hypothetical protein